MAHAPHDCCSHYFLSLFACVCVFPPLVFPQCDMMSEKLVETARGQALADEYGIKFFETSAKSNINVVEGFTAIATDIKKRLMDNPAANANAQGQGAGGVKVGGNQGGAQGTKEGCCK